MQIATLTEVRPMVGTMPAVDLACSHCLDTLYNGACLNAGCIGADSRASRLASGERVKSRLAPAAFTIGGRVD